MGDQEIIETVEATTNNGFSRRNFIKGVIATGAAVSSTNYLFRGTPARYWRRPLRPGRSSGSSR